MSVLPMYFVFISFRDTRVDFVLSVLLLAVLPSVCLLDFNGTVRGIAETKER